MRWYRRRRTKTTGRKLLVILGILLVLVLLIDSQLRPLIKTLIASQARQISTVAINDAITKAIEEEGSDALVHVDVGSDGKVNTIQTDIARINRLKALASNKILEKFGENTLREIKIPIGTLLGNDFTRGRGPKIPLLVELRGNVYTEVTSDLSGAGINQTLHRIILKVKTSVYVVIPGYNTSTDLETDFVIAETVIVGEVPDNFVNLSGEYEKSVDEFSKTK